MISLQQVGLFLPQGYLFKDVNLQIKPKDRIGLVGKNGAGKSTLLKLISGLEKTSEGNISMPKDTTLGVLTQDLEIKSSLPVFDYVEQSNIELMNIMSRIEAINHELTEEKDYASQHYLNLLNDLHLLNDRYNILGGYQWKEKVSHALMGLGFSEEEFKKNLNTFSGGWKMRAELAKILVNNPDILLLDEPTNHLDIVSIAWLENYLQTFSGALVLISHDRMFLDKATNRTWEISNQKIYDFPYPYSKYKIAREEEIERLREAQKNQEKEIKRTEELIDKFRAKKNKAAFAQGLIKKLERTERIEVDSTATKKLKIRFPLIVEPGKWVLELNDVGKSYGDKRIFENISIAVGKGEKIALLGPNGVGKSTLLKCIMNQIDYSGTVAYGHNVNITYFAQNQAEKLEKTKSVFEIVDDVASGEIRKDIRSILGAFLFSGEDIEKPVSVLSGGERTRLALCQLLLSPSNVLILDEPTNHLDIQSKEVLKEALQKYEGTFIIVSHDREFLKGLTNRIWDIDKGGLKIHHFDIEEFLELKINKSSAANSAVHANAANVTNAQDEQKKNLHQEQKELKRNRQKLENSVKKVEERITLLEEEIEKLNAEIEQIDFVAHPEQSKIFETLKEKQDQLESAMSEWEQLHVQLENVTS